MGLIRILKMLHGTKKVCTPFAFTAAKPDSILHENYSEFTHILTKVSWMRPNVWIIWWPLMEPAEGERGRGEQRNVNVRKTKLLNQLFQKHISSPQIMYFYIPQFGIKDNCITLCMCSCGSVVEHCVSSAKVVCSIPREHTYWPKMYNSECTVSHFG